MKKGFMETKRARRADPAAAAPAPARAAAPPPAKAAAEGPAISQMSPTPHDDETNPYAPPSGSAFENATPFQRTAPAGALPEDETPASPAP